MGKHTFEIEFAGIRRSKSVNIKGITPRDDYEKSILKKKILFSPIYGWVDLTHAFTDTTRDEPYIGIEKLWDQLKTPPSPDRIYRGYFSVNYKQDIIKNPLSFIKLSIGIERQYLLKPNLSLSERKSIALAIVQDVTIRFESLQSLHPTSGSSFEPADLPSNMLNFYRNVDGISKNEIEELIGFTTPKQSIEVYRMYPGTFTDKKYKHYKFSPPKHFASPYTSDNFGTPDRLNTIIPAKISTMKDFGKENFIFIEEDMIKRR